MVFEADDLLQLLAVSSSEIVQYVIILCYVIFKINPKLVRTPQTQSRQIKTEKTRKEDEQNYRNKKDKKFIGGQKDPSKTKVPPEALAPGGCEILVPGGFHPTDCTSLRPL